MPKLPLLLERLNHFLWTEHEMLYPFVHSSCCLQLVFVTCDKMYCHHTAIKFCAMANTGLSILLPIDLHSYFKLTFEFALHHPHQNIANISKHYVFYIGDFSKSILWMVVNFDFCLINTISLHGMRLGILRKRSTDLELWISHLPQELTVIETNITLIKFTTIEHCN